MNTKKIIISAILALMMPVLSARSVREDLEEYLPIARSIHAGNHEALKDAEAIAPHNFFAAIMLYYVYTRGYFGREVDYAKAAKYFNSIPTDFKYDGLLFQFNMEESERLWGKRLPPTATVKSVVIKVAHWDESTNWDCSARYETIRLRGKIPLIKCILEYPQTGGGVIPRALIRSRSSRSTEEDKKIIMAELDRMGKFDHRLEFTANPIPRDMSSADFQLLRRGMKNGDLFSKYFYAIGMLECPNSSPNYNPPEARKILREIKPVFEKAKADGCVHTTSYLEAIEHELAIIPEDSVPTAELLQRYDRTQKQNERKILEFFIVRRNDHPDCALLRAVYAKDKSNFRKTLREAWEKGSTRAAHMLLRSSFPDPDRWRYLYSLDKAKVPFSKSYSNWGPTYQAAVLRLLNNAYSQQTITQKQYEDALRELASSYPVIKRKYPGIFGKQNDVKASNVEFAVSDPEALKLRYVTTSKGTSYALDVFPSDQHNYLDIFVKSPRRMQFSMYGPKAPPNHVWGKAELFNGRLNEFGLGNAIMSNGGDDCPRRIRINVPAGNKKFSIYINL